ncbi:MAG: glycosyltransferase [Firmicutes bacterium]|nr:glycosyltransferase [Bacillota bacterium]
MLAAVVPARDEEGRIGRVLQRLLRLPLDLIIPVVNGSADRTWSEVLAIRDPRVQPLHYAEALGLDVPRAVGARAALAAGAQGVLFVDGDMAGHLEPALRMLLQWVRTGRLDMALCHVRRTPPVHPGSMASRVQALRLELNHVLGLRALGDAIPSHGPHAVSRRFLQAVPLRELALPPVSQALAVRAGLRVGVGALLDHRDLGHCPRPAEHRRRVGETLVGDCLEAIAAYRGEPRTRERDGVVYLGYHPERRLDLLEDAGGAGRELGGAGAREVQAPSAEWTS